MSIISTSVGHTRRHIVSVLASFGFAAAVTSIGIARKLERLDRHQRDESPLSR